MDIIRGIGNWFRGAFGRDDDEERRRRQQEQQRRQSQPTPTRRSEPTIQRPAQLFGQQDRQIDTPSPTQPTQLFQTEISPRREGLSRPASLRPGAQPNIQNQVEDAARKLASGRTAAPYHPDVIRQAQPRAQQLRQQEERRRQIANPNVREYNRLSPNEQRNYEQRLKEYRDSLQVNRQNAAEIRRINEALQTLQQEGNRRNDLTTTLRGIAAGMGEAAQRGITNPLGSQLETIYSQITGNPVGMLRTTDDIEEVNRLYREGGIDYDTLVRAFRDSSALSNLNNNWTVDREAGIRPTRGTLERTANFARRTALGGTTAAEFLPIGFTSNAATRLARFGSRFLQGGGFNAALSGAGSVLDTTSTETPEQMAQDAAISFLFGGLIEGVAGGRPRNVDLTSATNIRRVAVDRAMEADPSISRAEAEQIVDAAANQLGNRRQTNRGNLQVEEQSPHADLEAIINDPNQPAFRRRQAREELNRRRQAEAQAELSDPGNEPTFQFNRRVQEAVNDLEQRMNDEIATSPDQSREAIEAIRNRYRQMAEDLVESMRQNRETAQGLLDEQAEAQAEQLAEQVARVQQATEQRTSEAMPSPGDQVAPPPASPEVTANNAYAGIEYGNARDMQNQLLERIGLSTQRAERGGGLASLFGTPLRAVQEGITDPLIDAVGSGIGAMQRSSNPLVAGAAQMPRSIWSRFGMGTNLRAALDRTIGTVNSASDVGLRIARRRNQSIKELIDSGQFSREQIVEMATRFFESPEFIARMYGDGNKLTIEQLPPQIRQIVEEQIELNKLRNRMNFEAGLIDEAAYVMGQDGMHTPRVYGADFSRSNRGRASGGRNFDDTAGIERQDLENISDELFETVLDPFTAQDIRFQVALRNKARLDAIEQVMQSADVHDRPPNSGYTKLSGRQFGALDGKYVDNQVAASLKGSPVFKTQIGEGLNNLLDIYRDSPLGTADRFFKQTKTVGSVGTHMQNIGSNITLFATGAGVNPVRALQRGIGGAKSLIEDARGGFDPDLHFLRQEGVITGNTGRALNGVPERDLIKIESLLSEAQTERDPRKATRTFARAWSILQDTYGGTDDAFKLGIFRELKRRGYSDELALRRVREQFQNYENVGHGVALAADSPVLGQPFARFAPELVRITGNTARNNPLGLATGVGGAAILQDQLSKAAGESEEDRALREGAVGQTKLPGTSGLNRALTGRDDNVSLNFRVGDSSVNVARAVGLNFPIEPGGDPNQALWEGLSPVRVPVRQDRGGHTVFAPEEVVSSMTLNPIARLFANRDFMGRRITDPENITRYEGGGHTETKYQTPDGQPMDDERPGATGLPRTVENQLRSLFMAYTPFSSELDAAQAGIRGVDDYYGKQRSPLNALMRSFGIKVEDNDEEARERRREMAEYYGENQPEVHRFLDENPDLNDAYWALKSTARDRYTDVSQNDLVSPERYRIIAQDSSGRLYDFLKKQHQDRARKEGLPIDPMYSDEFTRDQINAVLQVKSMYTGDDTKMQQMLYMEPWYNAYKEKERQYHEQMPEREEFEGAAIQNPRPQEWFALSEELYSPEGVISRFPLVQEYNRRISEFPDYDSDERRAFTRAWFNTYGDAYNEQKDAYESARLNLVNRMRAIEGVAPLSPEVWASRFQSSDSGGSGYGGGYGRGRGGGGRSSVNLLSELTNLSRDVTGRRVHNLEAEAMPNLVPIFRALMAGGGGGRARPRLGASSRGRN